MEVLKTNTILLLLTKCNFTNKRSMVLQLLKTNTIPLLLVKLLFANNRSIGSWIITGVPFTTGKSFTWSQCEILFGKKIPQNSHCAGQPSAFGGGLTAFFPSVFRCHMCYKLGRCFRSGLPFKISFAIQRQRRCHS